MILLAVDVLGVEAMTPALRITAVILIGILSALVILGWEKSIKREPTGRGDQDD